MIAQPQHKTSNRGHKISPKQWVSMLLLSALCVSFVYDYQVINFEAEIELVEGEDNQSASDKKEKKEIELIQGTIAALCNASRYGNMASTNCYIKGEFVINIPTPPPEMLL